MRPPAATASLAVLLAVAVGATTGGLPLGRPTRLLRAPYVADVPGGLQAAFLVLAVVGVVAAVVLSSVAILLEAALAFLGVGIPPPTPSWPRRSRCATTPTSCRSRATCSSPR